MFFHHFANNILILLIYVDDIIVINNNSSQVFSFISYLNSPFSIHYLSRLNYFLGVEVVQGSTTLHLNHYKYIHDLLIWINMMDSKPTLTPRMLVKTLSQQDMLS